MAKPFKSWTSNKSMSWGGLPDNRSFGLGMGLDTSNYAMQKNLKPIWSKDSGLPDYFLPLVESGKDKRTGKGMQFSLAPPINSNAVIKNKGNTYEVMQKAGLPDKKNPQPKKGIQTSTGYIMEDTLFKENKFGYTGADTIAGMSEQYITTTNKDGIKTQTLVRGNNYANINYPSDKKIAAAAAAKKTAQEQRDKLSLLLPHINTDGSIKPPKESDESKGSGGASTSHPGAVGGSYAVGGSRPGGYGSSRRGKGKGAKRARVAYSQIQAFKRNPFVLSANSIQSELGRSPMVSSSFRVRIGYGNRVQQLPYEPTAKSIINDYTLKTTVNTWAKTINPEHAKLTERTYKDVPVGVPNPVTNYSNKGEEMDMLYDKVMKKSKEKKTKYKTYFETHPDVVDHNYYAIKDEDFNAFKEHKNYLLENISNRRSNQKEIIDRLEFDTNTIEQKDRSDNIIPVLESDIDTLDTKATTLKKQIGELDWQKHISQGTFGTDTIQGESHVSGVLDSYGGQVRGGNYYAQDVGNLVRKTKTYESELETEIKQQTSEIESIEPDSTEGLVDYFNDKSTKENAIASKDYLSKSLELTKEDRIKLERARNASAFGANQQATIARPKQTRSRGKPSLKRNSKQGSQYKNTRTRGGKNNLGGLVI